IRHRRNRGDDFLALDLFQETSHQGFLHRLMDEMDVHEAGWIGDHRMTAIEDADFHQFPWRHVLHELHSDFLERRTAGREVVLQHPLAKRLAEYWPRVAYAELFRHDSALAVAGCGRDAVHHGIGEGDIVANPCGYVLVHQPRQSDDAFSGDAAIVGN